MKKVLSMVLVLALVLTTLVVPMTVSAADGDVTIAYEISAVDKDDETRQDGKIYPGDIVTVTVKASGNLTMEGYDILVPYSNITVTTEDGALANYGGSDFVKFFSNDAKTVTSEGVVIGTFSFPAPGVGDYTINAVDNSLSYFGDGWDESKFTTSAQPYAVSYHEASATVTGVGVDVTLTDGGSNDAATESATELTFTIASSTNSEITNAVLTKDTVAVEGAFAEGATTYTTTGEASDYGTYKITFDTADGKTHTYTFIYKTNTTIDLKTTVVNAGFKPNDTISVEYSVDNDTLSDSELQAVTFDLTYDSTIFDVAVPAEDTETTISDVVAVEGATKSVSWTAAEGNGITAESESGVFATLTFTVKAEAKVAGTYSIAMSAQKAALNGYIVEETAVQPVTTNDTAYVTVYGENTFAVTPLDNDWTQSKTANVDYNDGWSAKSDEAKVVLAKYAGQQTNAEAIYTAGTEIDLAAETDNITIDTAEYYYVVARYGSNNNYVYAIVKEFAPTDVKIDKTAPTIALKGDEITLWANNTTRPIVAFDINDNNESGATKVEYNFDNGVDFQEAVLLDGVATVTLPTGEVVCENIYLKATDDAGNVSEATTMVVIYYDNKKPVIAAPEAGIFDGTGVTITSTLTDEGNASGAPDAVEVWSGDAKVGDATLTGTDISYKVTSNGTYTFKATDDAGNTGENSIIVTNAVSESTLVAPIFQVVQGEDAPTGYFKGVQDLTALGLTTNGTFTYVKITPGVAPEEKADKLTTTYMLQKDQDMAQDVSTGIALNATDNAGTYTLTATTIYGNNPNDNKTETYKFTIAGAYDDNFLTVNGDNKYRVTDWRILDLLADAEATDANFKETITVDERQLWQGGYFAGDVDGSLEAADWFDDATTLLTELKTARVWAQYQFALFNNLPVVE